ncbi:Holliday junction resolvase RuvX [Candidatus Kaiserbacteria bacterium]|nr:Holliday junction resolvase RuvX [Candidatus Kaiserbacteria bacterium]
MRILGIDYGTKRIGIALSDDTLSFAFPKTVFKNKKDIISGIKKIVEENDVSEIVIGQSLNLKGGNNPLMENIRTFSDALGKEIGIPIHFEPEYFTSVEARKSNPKEGMIDASAAALILQRFLDKRKERG